MPELSQPWSFAGFSTRNGSERLYDIELIKQDLLNHFHTRRGELDWDPEYGSIIPDILFENQNNTSRNLLEEEVRRIISSDPRIALQELTITEIDHGYQVNAYVNYLGRNPAILMQIEFDNRNF
jgi:phage baseplate assembly protein W